MTPILTNSLWQTRTALMRSVTSTMTTTPHRQPTVCQSWKSSFQACPSSTSVMSVQIDKVLSLQEERPNGAMCRSRKLSAAVKASSRHVSVRVGSCGATQRKEKHNRHVVKDLVSAREQKPRKVLASIKRLRSLVKVQRQRYRTRNPFTEILSKLCFADFADSSH